ncbi:MAG: hypothetical protein GXO65_01740 [Euryarchaeota archaeon]|nr:hypothetical protein [Euryarchaeota archaeon]
MIKEEISSFLKREVSEQLGKVAREGLDTKMENLKAVMKRTLVVLGLWGLGLLFVLLGFAKYLPKVVGISEGRHSSSSG